MDSGKRRRQSAIVDPELAAAARALGAGNLLEALKRVGLRRDAAALGLRGVVYARMGQLERARDLLGKAARAFGSKDPLGRARCLLADAEIALVTRDLRGVEGVLAQASEILAARGDHPNAAHATCLAARSLLLRGSVEDAEALLSSLDLRDVPQFIVAEAELARAEAALQKPVSEDAHAALIRAERAANAARTPAFFGAIAALRARLSEPVARAVTRGQARLLPLRELEALLGSPTQVLVDARTLELRGRARRVNLARRPVLFTLLRALAEAWPEAAPRAELIARAFGATRVNESHRARLRVEIARLRKAVHGLAAPAASSSGFRLQLRGNAELTLLTSPSESAHETVLALLRDGEAWSSSALALALGTSQRSVQRALHELLQTGRVRTIGRARARRFLCAAPEITPALLLPPPLEIA